MLGQFSATAPGPTFCTRALHLSIANSLFCFCFPLVIFELIFLSLPLSLSFLFPSCFSAKPLLTESLSDIKLLNRC